MKDLGFSFEYIITNLIGNSFYANKYAAECNQSVSSKFIHTILLKHRILVIGWNIFTQDYRFQGFGYSNTYLSFFRKDKLKH